MAVTVVLTAINNFVGILPLSLFGRDVILALLTLSASVVVAGYLIRRVKENIRRRGRAANFGDKVAGCGKTSLALLAFALLTIWNGWLPVSHLFSVKWVVCGTFIGKCHRGCLYFFDARGRQESENCISVEDDSSYLEYSAPDWWTYTPAFVSMQCVSGASLKTPLMPQILDGRCGAVMQLQ
jgi:hypothetical protein